MSHAHILGFPRIGARRELKTAVEAHWKGQLDEAGLRAVGRELRNRHWALQQAAGLDCVTVGDFAFYDHLHNATALFSAAPARFGLNGPVDLAGYFAMARGTPEQPALAMKKWFDTNYHYLVPELTPDTVFSLDLSKPLGEYRLARTLGLQARPVLVNQLAVGIAPGQLRVAQPDPGKGLLNHAAGARGLEGRAQGW